MLLFAKLIRLVNSQTETQESFKQIKIDSINSTLLNPLIHLIMANINND